MQQDDDNQEQGSISAILKKIKARDPKKHDEVHKGLEEGQIRGID